MNFFYLKGCKWKDRNDFFGYRKYEALASYIIPFKKNVKLKGLA